MQNCESNYWKLISSPFTPGETKNVAKQTESIDRTGQSCAER